MSIHYLPDTPEFRAHMAQGNDEALKAMGLDPHVVAPWEDGYRAKATEDSTFEWWYFDMQLDDGSTLVVVFFNKDADRPHEPVSPSVLVIHQKPDGTRTRHTLPFPAAQFSAATDKCDVKIGPNTVTGDLNTYALHVEDEGLAVDLTITRVAPSWRPGASLTYFNKAKTEFLAWVVPVPYGTVAGTLTVDGQAHQITGSAYHDHNWGNRQMGSMLDHWFWGRAHIDDFTLIYVCMVTRGLMGVGHLGITTLMVAKGDQVLVEDGLPLRLETTGEVAAPGHQHYPTELTWTWQQGDDRLRMHITNPTLIEALDRAPDGPKWRHPIANFVDHPMYYDFNADMTLDVDVKGVKASVTGRTLYEKMIFR